MGGICGVLGKDDLTSVKKMSGTLAHRGPEEGMYSDNGIALADRGIGIGPTGSGRPAHSRDGAITALLDGHIFNSRELRGRLEGQGSDALSDAELVAQNYEDDPEHFLEKMEGSFALAVWDSGRKRLTLARDHLGQKPLYYCQQGAVLCFASEIKAILAGGADLEVDEEMIDCYLGYGFCLGDRTLFKGVRKLMPGHLLRASEGRIELSQYWDIVPKPATTTELAAVEQLRRLLELSAESRNIAGLRSGGILSGDIDSAAAVALSKQRVTGVYHTFSIASEDKAEQDQVRAISDHLGTAHHELVITSGMVAKSIQEIAFIHDEPVGDPSTVNEHFLCREASDHVKLIVNGRGGKVLFAGDPIYARNLRFEETRHKMYGGMARSLMGIYPRRGDIFHNWREQSMFAFEADSIEEMTLRSFRGMDDREVRWLRGREPSHPENLAVLPRGIRYRADRVLYIDCRNRLPEQLASSDKVSMACGVEERSPLLARTVAEFAFTLPPSLKFKAGEDQYVLRLAVKDLLPSEVVKQRPSIRSAPADDWMHHEVREMMVAELDSSAFLKGHFQKARLERISRELSSGGNKASGKIWTIYALGLWHGRFFGR